MVRELSIAFKPKKLLLSSAVSPSKTIIDKGYDVAELSKYFDWIAVMTYGEHEKSSIPFKSMNRKKIIFK